jgi:hypothetical protein
MPESPGSKDLEIAELEAKLEKLKKEKAEFDSLPLNHRLADLLHAKFCFWNHTDGCGWYYFDDFTSSDKKPWVEKADNILRVCRPLQQYDIDLYQFILSFIKCL